MRTQKQEDRWKEWRRWPEQTNQKLRVCDMLQGAELGVISEENTYEFMGLMTFVNMFFTHVTSEAGTF